MRRRESMAEWSARLDARQERLEVAPHVVYRATADAPHAMQPMTAYGVIPTSGTARRRTKAIRNRQHVEDIAFYRDGTIPASSTAVSICSCGARSFTRRESGDLNDFDVMHELCDEYDEGDS